MEKIKSLLIVFIVFIIVAIVGYWAFITLEPGSLSAEKQKEADLARQNQDLQTQVSSLQNQLDSLNSQVATSTTNQNTNSSESSQTQSGQTSPSSSTTTYKNQTLINALQQLITANIVMKLKSQGSRVGTIQTFLNLYNKTSLKVDNDYGASTKTSVTNFQKDQGLTADGNAGPSTFQKMIDWLKKQG